MRGRGSSSLLLLLRLVLVLAVLFLGLFNLPLEAGYLPLEALAVLAVVVIGAQVADLGAVALSPARRPVGFTFAVQAVGEVDIPRVDLRGQEPRPRLVYAEPRAGDPVGILVLVLVEFVVRVRPPRRGLQTKVRTGISLVELNMISGPEETYRNSRVIVCKLGCFVDVGRRILKQPSVCQFT